VGGRVVDAGPVFGGEFLGLFGGFWEGKRDEGISEI
jgi:hypothetical protein